VNYDKIILELLSRVQTLEEQMAEVKSELANRYDEHEDDDEEDVARQDEVTRSQAREKAIKIIQSKFPDYLVEKASRKEGSGIKVIKPDIDSKRAIFIKFFHSKTYEHRTGAFEHAWHTVNLNDIIGTYIDYCMFSVLDKNGNWNFLIYEPDELGLYNEQNRSAKSELLHLYFVIEDGKAKEVRENTVDVTDHLNNWDVLR